ncbi:hypothetical protein ACO0QE_002190 [Hanseniaspora vineae]
MSSNNTNQSAREDPNGVKTFRACDRCRKSKIKCDSTDRYPESCSHCLHKNVKCEISVMGKPFRCKPTAKDFHRLYNSINDLNELMTSLQEQNADLPITKNEEINEKYGEHKIFSVPVFDHVSLLTKKIVVNLRYDSELFYINNYSIKTSELDEIMHVYNTTVISDYINIYKTWHHDKLFEDPEHAVSDLHVDWRKLFTNNELLQLLIIFNFYLDIPFVDFDFQDLVNTMIGLYSKQQSLSKEEKEEEEEDFFLFAQYIPYIIDAEHFDISKKFSSNLTSDYFIKNFTKIMLTVLSLHGPTANDELYSVATRLLHLKKIDYIKHWDLKFHKFIVLTVFAHCRNNNWAGKEEYDKNLILQSLFWKNTQTNESLGHAFLYLISYDEKLLRRHNTLSESRIFLYTSLKSSTSIFNFPTKLRLSYIQMFLCQLVSLNLIYYTNKTGDFTYMDDFKKSKGNLLFNGWNYELPKNEKSYHHSQYQIRTIHGKYETEATTKKLLNVMTLPICKKQEPALQVKELGLLDVVSWELHTGSNIQKSADSFIYHLYREIIQRQMLETLSISNSQSTETDNSKTLSHLDLQNGLQLSFLSDSGNSDLTKKYEIVLQKASVVPLSQEFSANDASINFDTCSPHIEILSQPTDPDVTKEIEDILQLSEAVPMQLSESLTSTSSSIFSGVQDSSSRKASLESIDDVSGLVPQKVTSNSFTDDWGYDLLHSKDLQKQTIFNNSRSVPPKTTTNTSSIAQDVALFSKSKYVAIEPKFCNPAVDLDISNLIDNQKPKAKNSVNKKIVKKCSTRKSNKRLNTQKTLQKNSGRLRINNVLKDVDWIKDSTEDVLQKIHGVLEA